MDDFSDFNGGGGDSFDSSGMMDWSGMLDQSLQDMNFDTSMPSGSLVTPDFTTGGGGSSGGGWGQILSALAGGTGGRGGQGGGLLSGLLGIGSGILGMNNANALKGLAQTAMGGSNPFGPYRKQYADQLSALMKNPNSITSDPGYKFAFDQGDQAITRRMAAGGYAGSGNMAIALKEYGQDFSGKYLMDKENQLAGLAGANITPNYGPGLQAYGAGVDTLSQSLASLGYGGGTALQSILPMLTGAGTGYHPSSAGGEAAGLSSLVGEAGAAYSGAAGLAKVAGTSLPSGLQTFGKGLGIASSALGVYQGFSKGGVMGDLQGTLDLAKLASQTGVVGAGVGQMAGYAAIPLELYNFAENWQSGSTGSDTLSGAETGASIGTTFLPGIGTIVGGVIGGAVGALSSAFGPGAKDVETSVWDKYLTASQKNPNVASKLSNPYIMLAGVFDEHHSTLPMYQQYGRMGEERFTVDMTKQINKALQSGMIHQGEDPNEVYQKVVAPWVGKMGNGWNNVGPEYTQAAQSLLEQMTAQYMNGQWGQWKARSGDTPASFGSISPFGQNSPMPGVQRSSGANVVPFRRGGASPGGYAGIQPMGSMVSGG